MFAPLRFLWHATRGYRFTPWRSPYLRWRLETYSGLHAETMTLSEMAGVVWRDKGQFLRFLRWTGQMERESNRD
ncbi:hypothetical protein [Terriglobus aquaticus]|uniref:Uncharacterized protein n=1 Tax=Terriglobus aquaticus TaxID=940139 RepID=A0ABW9KK00_9BACT|nr:hypothetical protein [Terriglobus aquaticus]